MRDKDDDSLFNDDPLLCLGLLSFDDVDFFNFVELVDIGELSALFLEMGDPERELLLDFND
jgi:hypothetical protein